MTPLHFPCTSGKKLHLPFAHTSLKFGEDLLLSPNSLTRASTCKHVPVDHELAYASLLRPLLPYVTQALDEAFPTARGKLELTSDGEFAISTSHQRASRHALDEALKFVFAVEQGAPSEEKLRHLSLFVAYCVAALVARSLKDFPTADEKAWLATSFVGVRAARAGFTSKAAHTRYSEQMETAQAIEKTLPLEVRLGLDRHDPLLPTQRVRAPGEAVTLAIIPWPGLLGAEIPVLTTFDAADRLSCDVYAERFGSAAQAVGRLGQQQVSLAEGVSDLETLLGNVTAAMGSHTAFEMALASAAGTFRSSSFRLESYGRVFHVWRPLSPRRAG
jgi:hypothetical protein